MATIGKVDGKSVCYTVHETRRGIVETIKANPIPAALVGVGLAWMWMSGSGEGGRRRGALQPRPRQV